MGLETQRLHKEGAEESGLDGDLIKLIFGRSGARVTIRLKIRVDGCLFVLPYEWIRVDGCLFVLPYEWIRLDGCLFVLP